MREFLDRYSIRQIVTGVIIAAVLGVEILFYILGDGWHGVKIITIWGACVAAVLGLVYATFWLYDYIDDRKSREFWEKKRKEANHDHTRATGL